MLFEEIIAKGGSVVSETLLIGIGVVILFGQNLVAVVADSFAAFVTFALAIGGAALIRRILGDRFESSSPTPSARQCPNR